MYQSLIVLSTSFPRSAEDDAGVFVFRLVEALSHAGAEGTVIVPKDKEQETLQTIGTFSIARFRYGIFARGGLAFGAGIIPNLKHSPWLSLQIPQFIASFFVTTLFKAKPKTTLCAQWIISGFIAWLVSAFKDSPYIITMRGEDLRLLDNRLLKMLFSPALKRAKAVVTVSESLRVGFLEQHIVPGNRVHVIENGVDTQLPTQDEIDLVCKERSLDRGERFLLFIGTVIPRKCIDRLIHILSQPELKSYRLRICGRVDDQMELKKLKQLLDFFDLNDRVSFEGAVPPRHIPSYLSLAAAYITASSFEGRPNAVLEALALGKFVFASDIPAHREIIVDQKNGVILEARNYPKNAQTIARILSAPDRYEHLALEARASVSNLTWQKSARRYLELTK